MPEKKTAPGCEFMFVHQEIVERVNAAMPAEETLFDLAEPVSYTHLTLPTKA